MTGSVTYDIAQTVHITDIEPIFASVVGGDILTFTLSSAVDASTVTIHVDGVLCASPTSSGTSVSCTLGALTEDHEPEILFDIGTSGLATVGGNEFLYAHDWFDIRTWGNEGVPYTGQSVHIPKGMNVFYEPPMIGGNIEIVFLDLVLIEGALIFVDKLPGVPTYNIIPTTRTPQDLETREFHAHVIFINKGRLQAGTEDKPVWYNLRFVLHGEKYGPGVPLFGNKVIANYGGTLDLHGREENQRYTSFDYGSPNLTFGSNMKTSFLAIGDLTRWF